MTTLHLLDATYELFRAFFALPSERSPAGQEVGAIRGLIGSVLALLRDLRVTHIAAATDCVVTSFRNDLFAGYKTGAGVAPELLAQFPLAERALRTLGITVWPMIEFEADDALASAAVRFEAAVERVVILSADKDLCQCVRGQHVVAYDRWREKLFDEAGVLARFGVVPAAIPDFLALVGDTADGIPGIEGWGPKSAAIMLQAYGSIANIPDDVGQWVVRPRGAERLAAALAGQRAAATLYKQLATLRTDVPLHEQLADLSWQGVPRRAYQEFCRELGFGKLAERPTIWAAEGPG